MKRSVLEIQLNKIVCCGIVKRMHFFIGLLAVIFISNEMKQCEAQRGPRIYGGENNLNIFIKGLNN